MSFYADSNLVPLGKRLYQVIRRFWYVVPKFMRVMAYRRLAKSAQFVGGLCPVVQRFPFGLYLKECRRDDENEQNALRLVERHTSIPAPLFVDSFKDGDKTFFVMTGIGGQTLEDVYYRMSYEERDQLTADITRCIGELRRIPNTTAYLIANTVGGPLNDHRIPRYIGGPFETEADFNHFLARGRGSPEEKKIISAAHSRKHQIIFSHSDLHPSNIFIEQGRFSGIVDWECAGYWPEYWEYTRALNSVMCREEWATLWRRIYGNRFGEELRTEKILWNRTLQF